MRSPSAHTKTRIAPLDGIRGLAVGLVVLDHVAPSVPVVHDSPFLLGILASAGTLGVNIFFVLSGYLITTLLILEKERTGTISLTRFYVRRTKRIFPAFYVYLACIAILATVGSLGHVRFTDLLIDALYLHNFGIADNGNWYTGHSWSLDIEEQFYLLWPALMLAGITFSTRFAVICIILEPIVRAGIYFAFPQYREALTVTILTRVDPLMFGCTAAIMTSRYATISAWFTSKKARTLAPIAFAILFLTLIPSARFRGTYNLTIGFTITGAFVAYLLPTLAKQPSSMAAKILSYPAFTWFGRVSYSVYLWQQLFLTPYHGNVLQSFPINLIATISCGAASYYLVERRFFNPRPIAAS